MIQLTAEEAEALRSQTVTLKCRGDNIKYLPYAFTEQGVAMLSSVLNSDRAVEVNIAIMRAFVRLREIMSTHKDLARKLAELGMETRRARREVRGRFRGHPPTHDPVGGTAKITHWLSLGVTFCGHTQLQIAIR